MALMKLALKKYFSGPATVSQYLAIFEKFIHLSANRAQRREPPLSYQEILCVWNTFISPNTMSWAMIEAIVDSRVNDNNNKTPGTRPQPQHQGDRGQGNRRGTSAPSPKESRTDFSQSWNTSTTQPLCSNTQTTEGCMDANGKSLIHSCNFRDGKTGQTCKSSKHG